ncbi:MAG: FtsX-like permease family protein [Chloroflexi bacterium]|nr:FtsX-like permease family protein [Chloroflexota bacterium]PWB43409.1 MAG: hypothetical protein C3F10_12060 [Dehalococcoidia bacterium]
MVALAGAAGTLTILSVLAVAAADRELNPGRYGDGGMDRMVTAIVAIIALQVAGLAAVTGRLSAVMRARRLSNLRLLGLSAGRTRLVAATEVAVAAAAGSIVAVAVFPAMRPVLARLRVGEQAWPASALDPGVLALVAVPALVTAATVALAVLPEQLGSRQALSQSRQSEAPAPAWWRVIPLLLGVGVCLYVQIARRGDEGAANIMLAGLLLLGAGMVLVVPLFVQFVAAFMLRAGRQVPLLLAGRRLQAQPAAVNRVITGLLLGLFLVVGARAVVVAFENTPQYRAAARQLTEEQRVGTTLPAAEVDEVAARTLAVPGVRQVITYPILTTACDDFFDPHHCREIAIVATCAQLAAIDPAVEGCRDGEVMAVGSLPFKAATLAITWMPQRNFAPDPAYSITVSAPQDTFTASTIYGVVIPPSLPQVAEIASIADNGIVVIGDPGRDLEQRLRDAGVLPNAHSHWDMADYDFVATLRSTVYTVAAVVMGLGLLAFAIAAIDRAIARRRELTSLRLAGIPAHTLRRSQWVEALVPIAGGAVLAIALGHFAGATYLAFGDTDLAAPWEPTLILAAAAAFGGVLIAALTVVATTQPITSETIRFE